MNKLSDCTDAQADHSLRWVHVIMMVLSCCGSIIILSFLRYGSSAVDDYKENLEILFKRLKETLPDNCLVIWCTTLPISKYIRGGFMIPQVAFLNSNLRLDLLEANFFVHKVCITWKSNG